MGRTAATALTDRMTTDSAQATTTLVVRGARTTGRRIAALVLFTGRIQRAHTPAERPVWSYGMRTAALVLMWIVRVAGIVQILLGLSIWIGVSGRFYSLHIPNGILIVGGLWGLAVLVLLARGRPGPAAFAFLWGLALPAFGLRQAEMLVGPWHWIIQVTHLLMGLIALGTADSLAKHVLTARTTTAGRRSDAR